MIPYLFQFIMHSDWS